MLDVERMKGGLAGLGRERAKLEERRDYSWQSWVSGQEARNKMKLMLERDDHVK
jgi:hypothetical protein